MANKKKLPAAVRILLTVLILGGIDFLVIRLSFNKYGSLSGSDYYATLIIICAIAFLISALILAFSIFPKETEGRKKKAFILAAVLWVIAVGASIPLIVSKDPSRDPAIAAMRAEEESRQNRLNESRAYAKELWESTSPNASLEDGEERYPIEAPFSVVQIGGVHEDSISIVNYYVDESEVGLFKKWTQYPLDAKTFVFLEYIPTSIKVVKYSEEYSDGSVYEEYYYADGYRVLVHIVEKDGNKRYHSFKLLETLSASAGEEVREALKEVLE